MWVLGLVILVDEMDKNIVRGMITPLKDEFGVGDLGISVLLSLALLFNGIITVPAGYLADRWVRTRAIGHTVVGWSALTAAGRRVAQLPDAGGPPLGARLRPGHHRAVGRLACSATTTPPRSAGRRSRSSR